MSMLQDKVLNYLKEKWQDRGSLSIINFIDLMGGYSKSSYNFDVIAEKDGVKTIYPLLLRIDSPRISALYQNSRELEHILLSRLAEHTTIPVPKSYFAEMNPATFGEPGMIIERIAGCTEPTLLFKDPGKAAEAESVARVLCEKLAALHTTDVRRLNLDGKFDDPGAIGIIPDSWEHYMDGMLNYFVKNYSNINFDALPVLYDAFLHIRRNKPRPLPLVLTHGDLNPSNIIFKDGKLLAIIDWEHAHIGDPREDLGWFRFIEAASGTRFFHCVDFPGGFLGYYNHLTGFDVSLEELDYFQIFGYANAGAHAMAAMKRRMAGQHQEILHLYLMQIIVGGAMAFSQCLRYAAPHAPQRA